VCYILIVVKFCSLFLSLLPFCMVNQDKEIPSMGQQWAQSVTTGVHGFFALAARNINWKLWNRNKLGLETSVSKEFTTSSNLFSAKLK